VRACVSVSVHVLFAESVCRVYVCGGIMLLVSPLLDRVVAVVELFFWRCAESQRRSGVD